MTLGSLPILARIVAHLLEIVLPLTAVVLMPRVGGFGHQNFSGKHGTTYGSIPSPSGKAVVLKASSEPLRKDAAECSGGLRACFRPRSRATAPVPQLRDGDSISFSMTLGLLPILARIVAYLLHTVRLLIVVASVLLVGGFGHRRVLPLISVALMPRVGGFGHQIFSGRLGIRYGSSPFLIGDGRGA